jgi:hypothetical protein
VIPSALGGRLKPSGLLSAEGNALLNRKIDLPLIRALHPLMALLGGSRDSGRNPPTKIVTNGGQEYLLNFGEPLIPVAPQYSVQQVRGGSIVTVRARDSRQLAQFLPKVQKEHPGLDIASAIGQATMESTYLSESVRGTLSVGPDPVFPATFAMASLIAAHLGQTAHPQFHSYVTGLPARDKPDDDGAVAVAMPPDTFYWVPPDAPIACSAAVRHVLAYLGDARGQRALAYIELFGLPGVAVLLPFSGGESISWAHGVDVLKGVEVPVEVNPQAIDSAWEETHARNEAVELLNPYLASLFAIAKARQRESELQRIAYEVFGDVEFVDDALIDEFARKVAEWIVATRLRSQ